MCKSGKCCWHEQSRGLGPGRTLMACCRCPRQEVVTCGGQSHYPIGYAVFCAQRSYGHNLISCGESDRSNETAAEADATLLDNICPCGPHFVRRVYGE